MIVVALLPARRAVVVCTCGTFKTVYRTNLRGGCTRSCGCLASELTSQRTTTHGATQHPLFHCWAHMLRRCYAPDTEGFHRYGGRGITVCEEWRNDFWAFAAHMGPRPFSTASIDRRDNDGHYEPGNVRWATVTQQQRNRSTNVYIDTPRGRMLVVEAAKAYGLRPNLIAQRRKLGWPPARWLEPSHRPTRSTP